MDFYNVLKYILMGALVVIIGLAAISNDDGPSTPSQPVPQQNQSKFNF